MSADLDLSRRADAAGWKWQPGALVWGGDRITEDTLGVAHGVVPDFNDAATRGVLLQQVRERWGNPYAYTVPVLDRNGLRFWAVWLPQPGGWDEDGQGSSTGQTETAALVAALEAAPKEKGL